MGVETTAMRIGGQMRRDRRVLAALVAVFALLVQALVPAAAMAAAPDASGVMVICTATGVTTVSDKAPGKPKGFAGMPCQDCLAAALAVTQTPELAVQSVTYAVARVEHAAVQPLLEPRARAPPRPPGQGPPAA